VFNFTGPSDDLVQTIFGIPWLFFFTFEQLATMALIDRANLLAKGASLPCLISLSLPPNEPGSHCNST
jgi:hypothetical protein